MNNNQANSHLLRVLAEFRYQLRGFLQFSQQAANRVGLHPQQHQLLLQVAGRRERARQHRLCRRTRLGLRHNSAVELVNRSVAGRTPASALPIPATGGAWSLKSQAKGRRSLKRRSQAHAQELRELGPSLIRSLKGIERRDLAQGCAPHAMKSQPSILRDFTVDRRVWLLSAAALVVGTGAAGAGGSLVALHRPGNQFVLLPPV